MELPNIPYSVSHRNVRYPRLEFRTGELLLVLPFGYKPDPILNKHKKWILKNVAFVEDCLKHATDRRMVERTEKEFRDLTFSLSRKARREFQRNLMTTRNWKKISSFIGFSWRSEESKPQDSSVALAPSE